jgi:hypothetical protein
VGTGIHSPTVANDDLPFIGSHPRGDRVRGSCSPLKAEVSGSPDAITVGGFGNHSNPIASSPMAWFTYARTCWLNHSRCASMPAGP